MKNTKMTWNSTIFLMSMVLLFLGCKKEPMSCFEVSVDGGIVNVNAECSSNEDAYSWDFGDGGTSIAKSASHTYANPGNYQITLRVDGEGESSTKSQSVTIAQVCKTCTCNIPFSQTYCGTRQNAEAWCSGCSAPGYTCNCN